MVDFITDEDVYEATVDILLLRFGFGELSLSEKVWTVMLFPVLYGLAAIGFIVFGWVTRERRAKKRR